MTANPGVTALVIAENHLKTNSSGFLSPTSQVDDDELEVLFKKYTVSGKGITFEKFVEFMWQATADTQSKDQVLMSFKTLAHNKECLTSEELQQVIEQLGPNLVEFCSSHMPATDGGFDYVKYITETFE